MIPSPMTWLTVPSYRCTASIIRSSTGSRSFRASSGSRSASNSIEPLRSAKSTVTCLRSPSSATLEVRIFSARCLGVYVSGERDVVDEIPWISDAPHSPQNFCSGGFDAPQERQTAARRAPHSPQNFWLGAFSCSHRKHFILWLVRPRGSRCPRSPLSAHITRRTSGGAKRRPLHSEVRGACQSRDRQ